MITFMDSFAAALAAFAPRHRQAIQDTNEALARFGRACIAHQQRSAASAAVPPDGDGTEDAQTNSAA
jgi:hypothetical protein